jgi:hypothetical protein
VQHYDSGLIQGGAEFPAIVVSIARNNMICNDTVFHLDAKPVLANEVAPFVLRGSSYQEGCFGPCDCAIVSKPLAGQFGLLPLGKTAAGSDFAVIDIRWLIRDAAAAVSGTPVTGYGLYRVFKDANQPANTPQQRMILDLLEGSAGPTRFDSGQVPGGSVVQRIDVDVAADGFACFDRVYSIHAKRRAGSSVAQSVKPEPVDIPVTPAP